MLDILYDLPNMHTSPQNKTHGTIKNITWRGYIGSIGTHEEQAKERYMNNRGTLRYNSIDCWHIHIHVYSTILHIQGTIQFSSINLTS